MSDQTDLFPQASPESVRALCLHAERRVHRLDRHLTRSHLLRLLGEIELFLRALDRIEDELSGLPPVQQERAVEGELGQILGEIATPPSMRKRPLWKRRRTPSP